LLFRNSTRLSDKRSSRSEMQYARPLFSILTGVQRHPSYYVYNLCSQNKKSPRKL
jgi:hypothetical protein